MNTITREEISAKMDALEAKMSDKMTQAILGFTNSIEGIRSDVRAEMRETRVELKDDARSSKWALWAIFAAVVLGLGSILMTIIFK